MNNSFDRLIGGMINTLRREVIPNIGTEFARGQAFGVIYMLESIRRRGGWSVEFFAEQIKMLHTLSHDLGSLIAGSDAPPLPEIKPHDTATAAELQAELEAGQERVCALLEWMYKRYPKDTTDERGQAIWRTLHQYAFNQIRWEISTSAKPMFAEISSGSE